MPRKRRRHSPRLTPAASPPPPPEPLPMDRWWLVFRSRKFWAWACPFLVGILGLFLWLPFYVANIYIDIAASSNHPLMPVPASFAVTNRGVWEAYSAEFICYYINVRAQGLTMKEGAAGIGRLADVLSGSQSVDVACPGIVGPIADESDIEFLISFRPADTWKRSYACARFMVKQNAHGRPQWFRIPPYECKPLWECLQDRREKMKSGQQEIRSCLPQSDSSK